MSVTYAVNATALNRLKVALASGAVTPASGASVDAAGAAGSLQIGTSSLSGVTGVLATITLQDPSFTFATRTATLAGTPLSGTASATGTAALAQICDSNNVPIITGLTVGTSGTDIIIGSTSITSGETVTVTSGTIAG
jgi:hypothetical protein